MAEAGPTCVGGVAEKCRVWMRRLGRSVQNPEVRKRDERNLLPLFNTGCVLCNINETVGEPEPGDQSGPVTREFLNGKARLT